MARQLERSCVHLRGGRRKIGTISSLLLFTVLVVTIGVVNSCKLSLDTWSPWQKDTITELRKRVKSEITDLPRGYMTDELYLARWVAARNFRVDEALELFKQNLEWRKEHRMDTILKENWKEMTQEFPYQLTAVDKLDRPLLYIKLGSWNIGKRSTIMHLPELGRYFAKIIEEADGKIRKVRAKGKNVTQFTILLDMDGYSMRKHGCLHCLSFYAGLGETLQSHFPRVAERIVFINAPPVFEVVFESLQRMLNMNARQSIEIFGPNRSRWEPALLEYLEPSQFPRDLVLNDSVEKNVTKPVNEFEVESSRNFLDLNYF